jgi:serine/threonine protein kinase/Flp pilus assembly protein TadD
MATAKPTEETLFHEASRIADPGQREAYLREACAGDAALQDRVAILLRAAEVDPDFLAEPVTRPGGSGEPDAEQPGRTIGPFKLLQLIGEGGMGRVYLAEQEHPVRRKVAVKVVKAGVDSRQVVARFEAERQALALMDHPNIARVLDAGATPDGRPYFVMELVRGVPLTHYCDEQKLSVRERLGLFVDVCHAVQHAHQKGVIHRDLKPSNVLVAPYDGKPVVKVIDFGVAKATGPRLTEQTLFTEFGTVIGTPEYMSPEQAELNNLDVDTRSDVYSLGVLLYELLTGTTPLERHRARGAPVLELLRVIREEETARPSTRLSTVENLPAVAASRKIDPAGLCRLVQGELDWIVMKSLEKDRNRRYETVSALAADVERYLRDERVLACPPTLWYRLRKFFRRNRVGLAVGGLLLLILMLVGGGIGWVVRDRVAREAVLEAKVQAALKEAETWYAQDQLLEAMAAVKRGEDWLSGGSGSEQLRQLLRQWRTDLELVARLETIRLDHAVERDEEFDHQDTDAAYQKAFANYGLDLANLVQSEAVRRIQASAIRNRLLAALDHWSMAKSAGQLPGSEQLIALASEVDGDPMRGQLSRALRRKDIEAVEQLIRDPAFFARQPDTLLRFASVIRHHHGVPLTIEVLTKAQQQHPGELWINYQLAHYLMSLQPPRAAEAVGYYRVAVAQRPNSAGIWVNLGVALRQQGKVAEAEAAYRAALRAEPNLAMAHNNLGNVLKDQKRYEEAEAEYRTALRLKPNYADALSNLGFELFRQKKLDEAEPLFRQAILLKPNHSRAHFGAGAVHALQNRYPEAAAEFRELLALEPNHAEGRHNLGIALLRMGKPEDAEIELRRATELLPNLPEAQTNLGVALARQRKFAEAETAFRAALRIDLNYALARVNLQAVLQLQGKPVEEDAAKAKQGP